MITFLDVDGVLANFVDGALARHGRSDYHVDCWKFYEKWGMSADQFWEPLQGRDFWVNLEVYDHAWQLYMQHVEHSEQVIFVTAPNRDPECVPGKLEWLRKHFSATIDDVIFTSRKHLLAGPNRLLVDDSFDNCKEFVEHGGQAQLFPQSWNNFFRQIKSA